MWGGGTPRLWKGKNCYPVRGNVSEMRAKDTVFSCTLGSQCLKPLVALKVTHVRFGDTA